MKKTITVLAIIGLVAAGKKDSHSQTNHKTVKIKMETVRQSKEVVQDFFKAFGKGDMNGIINSFHEHCTITAVREAQREGSQIYGSYRGREGAKNFILNLGNTFDTKAFSVDNIVSEGTIVFANGRFTHVVKSSGKSFSSDWALMCVVKDDAISEYHFYEDSEKFTEALK